MGGIGFAIVRKGFARFSFYLDKQNLFFFGEVIQCFADGLSVVKNQCGGKIAGYIIGNDRDLLEEGFSQKCSLRINQCRKQ